MTRRASSGTAAAGLFLAAALIPLNSTMIVVALLDIERDLGVNVRAVLWLVSGYLVVVALSQPLGGRIGDAYGHRRVFMIGLGGFLTVSALATFAPWFAALAVLRLAQGLFAGLIWPSASALLRDIASPGRRGRLFGWFGTVVGLAAAIGPVVGGGLVAVAGWRAIFLVNIPVGAAALAMTLRALPPDPARVRGRMTFDLPGAAAFTALVGAIVAALSLATAGVERWLPAVAAAGVMVAVFIRVERRAADPFVALSLFNHRPYVGATATVLLHNLVMYSLLLIVPIYAERELGLGSAAGGLLIGSMTGAMMFLSPVGGHLSDRFGRRMPALIGGALAIVATVGLVAAGDPPGIAGTAVFAAVAGAGIGLAAASLQTTAVESAPERSVGVASGVFTTMRYTGGIAAAGLAAAVSSSGEFRTGFAVLAAGAVLSLVSASALGASPPRRAEALTPA